MRRYLFCVILFILGLLSGCSLGEGDGDGTLYQVYYVNAEGSGIVPEEYRAHSPSKDTVKQIEELWEKMRTGGERGHYTSPIQAEEGLPDFQLKETQLSIHFSAAYNGKDVLDEILSRAAIVKTLCQVEGVDFVEFYVEDQPLMLSGNAVGLMNEDSFLESLNENITVQRKEVVVYYADTTGTGLREVTTEMTYNVAQPLADMLIQKLIEGPESVEHDAELLPTIPEGTVLNSATIRDNICYLDFSREFEQLDARVSSDVVIYSIVNTLCELPNVNKVQFSIEGEQRENYGETLHFTAPFERNLDIVLPEEDEAEE